MNRVATIITAALATALLSASCGTSMTAHARTRPFYGLDEPYASVTREHNLSVHLGVRPTVFSAFIRLDTTTTAHKMAAMREADMTPFITLEPWHLGREIGVPDPADSLRRLIAGDVDVELLRQARMLATYSGPFYLRFAHEMNAPWYPWGVGANGNTSADYVQAWRHVHRLFASVPGLHARWVWSPVTVQHPGVDASLGSLFPGEDVVDYVGLTGYEHHSPDPADTFDPSLVQLHAVSARPVVLSEIGSDGPNKPRWLASLGSYLTRRPTIAGFVYFDTAPQTTGATGDYELGTTADRTAFRRTLRTLSTT